MNLVSHPLALLPLVDVVAQYQSLNDELDRIVLGVLAKGRYVFGQEMEEFEEAFSQYTGARYCITSSSGTSALHLALLACGVGPGDEVIVPAMSFIASAWPITYVGATPIFAEVEWNSACIDPEKIEPLITPRTKAIVLVHLYGRVAAIDAIIDVAKKHNLLLIEDCCQAHGARFRGKHVGTFGHVGCFSFYPGKNLGTCGEGGAVITNDAEIASRCRRIRDHGQTRRYYHYQLGYNYRLPTLMAAVLCTKLRYLDYWNLCRKQLVHRYHQALRNLPLWLPPLVCDESHVWHLYTVRTPRRAELALWLNHRGIAAGQHYPLPLHLQPAFRHLGYKPGDFPIAERIARETLSLPLFPEMTERQQLEVIKAVHGFFGGIYD